LAPKFQATRVNRVSIITDVFGTLQLLGGWKDPIPRKVLKEELLLAATRCRMLLPAFSFHLDTTVNSLDAFHDIVSDLQLKKDNPNKVNYVPSTMKSC
jgi:hypothetical protein